MTLYSAELQNNLPEIQRIAARYKDNPEQLMRLLLEIQALAANAVPREVAMLVSSITGIPESKIYGYITFYAFFSTKPRGKYIIRMCKSAPCHINGAHAVVNAISRELGIKPGETTQDSMFTMEYCECKGLCDASPSILINNIAYSSLTPEKATEIIKRYKRGEVE